MAGKKEQVNKRRSRRQASTPEVDVAQLEESAQGRQLRTSTPPARADRLEESQALAQERIAERARALWQQRGCRAGEDERNWHEAEAQLKRELGIS